MRASFMVSTGASRERTVPFEIEISPTESFASILINGQHRILRTDPCGVELIAELAVTLQHAHLVRANADFIPTGVDLNYQLLVPDPTLGADLLPGIPE